MYVETFHCVLKVVYLESKQNGCVDHLFNCFALQETKHLSEFKSLKRGNYLIGLKKLIRGMGQLKK